MPRFGKRHLKYIVMKDNFVLKMQFLLIFSQNQPNDNIGLDNGYAPIMRQAIS